MKDNYFVPTSRTVNYEFSLFQIVLLLWVLSLLPVKRILCVAGDYSIELIR